MNVSCLKCRHYYSTFDQQHPRGCRLFSMKTAAFPSLAVKKETGKDCYGFEERKKNKKEELNLRDPKLW